MNFGKLSSAEERAFIDTVEETKVEVRREADAVKKQYIAERAPQLAERQNTSIDEAKEILQLRTAGELSPKDEIQFQELGTVSVEDVLSNTSHYDKKYCADPSEPEEGLSKALFFANDNTGAPLIHSMLHGGQNFYLQIEPLIQQKNRIQVSKKDVLDQLTGMQANGGVQTEQWCQVVAKADLSKSDTDSVIDYLSSSTGTKKTSLKQDLKAYKSQHQAELSFENVYEIAGDRAIVEYQEYDINGAIIQTEQAVMTIPGMCSYFSYGGVLSYSTYDKPAYQVNTEGSEKPPLIPVFKQYNRDNLTLRIEHSALFYKTKQDKALNDEKAYPIGVPLQVVNKLLEHPSPEAPDVSGLVTHPVVDMTGRVINEEGIDESTGLFLQYGGAQFISPPVGATQQHADIAAQRITNILLGEFKFKDSNTQKKLYQTAALAMLLTGVNRKVIDKAPGFLVAANVQGTGKTTLASVGHLILTGRDLPVSSLGGSPEEIRKEMLATLLQSSAMVCYDNILDGSEVNDATIAKILTSTVFKGRVLGKSLEASVPTNILMVLTGNNVTLGTDLVRRFITVHLTADIERPENRVYKNPDIVQHCLNHRRQVICDCLTITKAYIDAGCPIKSTEVGSSGFVQWDTMVRFPLLWATGVDVLHSMNENRQQSSQHLAMERVLSCLSDIYANDRFTASRIMKAIESEESGQNNNLDSLRESLVIMSGKALRSIKSLAWVLKTLEGRIVNGMILRKDQYRNRSDEYWVETVPSKEVVA